MIQGEARFPGGTPLSRELDMQESLGSGFLEQNEFYLRPCF